jgi:predicted amidophosphoribosyltransferase
MGDYDAIIPMPLSPQRIRERGFNQVLELLSVIKRKQQHMATNPHHPPKQQPWH